MARRKGVDPRAELHFPDVKAGPDGLTVDARTPLVRFLPDGTQVLENTPVEVPLGWNAPESIEVTIARMVRAQLSVAADAAGFETLDEAYDFDMPEGDDFEEHLTPAEMHAMMHAPEMKEEWPDVRQGTGSGKKKGGESDDGVGHADKRSSDRAEQGDEGNGSSSVGADKAPADRSGAKSATRGGVGKGNPSAGSVTD